MLMVIWYRGTQLERKHYNHVALPEHLEELGQLRNDTEVPLMCHNLVYLENYPDGDDIDRDILYSILDKDPKRARAYWFVSVNVLDEPDTMYYELETDGTDCIFRIRLNLGFKCSTKVNVWLRQIVEELQLSGELPAQDKKYSIYGPSKVGNFRFCMIHKVVTSHSDAESMAQRLLRVKYRIRHMVGDKSKWYGLDTSSMLVEYVPLVLGQQFAGRRIERRNHQN